MVFLTDLDLIPPPWLEEYVSALFASGIGTYRFREGGIFSEPHPSGFVVAPIAVVSGR